MDLNFDNLELIINQLCDVTIEGVYFKKLATNNDGRGSLTELWSQPWGESENVEKDIKHVYWNITHQGVIKGWHYHMETVSQYTCVIGKMQVVLVDVRESSSTRGQVNQFLIGEHNPSFIRIPPGLLKAWKSLNGDSVIVNLLNSANKDDNHKLPCDTMLKDIWEPRMG